MKRRSLYRNFVAVAAIFFTSLQFVLIAVYHSGDAHTDNETLRAWKNPVWQVPFPGSQDDYDDYICSRFPRGTLAATAWYQLRPLLQAALRHPRDIHDIHANWTGDLLHLLTPHVLEYTLKGFPDFETLRPLMGKLSRRVRRLATEDKSSFRQRPSPPFKIAVFGGSIVEGTGCMRSPIPGGKLEFESLQECSWPFRLEHALNHLLNHLLADESSSSSAPRPLQQQQQQPRWIEVHNLAAGGTNSEAAIPVLRYWLSPILHPKGADVIVNAYSANDNLPPAFHATANTTVDSFHFARIWQRNLQFVRAARSHQHPDTNNPSCRRSIRTATETTNTPMILYVNDYLGNQQESIVGEGQLHEAIQWLADLEATMGYVSVSHAVRRWVLADTSEEFFSAAWSDRKGQQQPTTVNVHYGMAGHVTTTIALLYYFTKVILDFCEEEATRTTKDGFSSTDRMLLHPEDLVQIEIPTKEWVQQYQPKIIRPNVTEWKWQRLDVSESATKQCYDTMNTSLSSSANSPCAFAFLAAPLGTHQRQDSLATFLEAFTLQRNGWEVQNDYRQGGFQNKLGLVAVKPGASMTLAVNQDNSNASSPIRVVTIQYLKSYGHVWKNSRVEYRAQTLAGDTIIHEQVWELDGHHDQAVSISYIHHMELTQPVLPAIGGSFRLQMTLVGGQIFKMNALMFCSL